MFSNEKYFSHLTKQFVIQVEIFFSKKTDVRREAFSIFAPKIFTNILELFPIQINRDCLKILE